MRKATFADAALDEGAAALNRVFEDYLVPVTFSSEQLHLHMTYNDVDPARSPLWLDDGGKVAAAALLAIRGKRGWIGGFGVAPEYRGKGLSYELLQAVLDCARSAGLESIQLEVLCANTPAIKTYLKVGFKIVRELYSFQTLIDEPQGDTEFGTASIEEFIDEPDPLPPCWQRERATIRNGAVSTAVADGQGSYALFRFNSSLAQVLKFNAPDANKITALAHAIARGRQFQGVLVLNEPGESPLTATCREARWNEPFVQHEMRLTLNRG